MLLGKAKKCQYYLSVELAFQNSESEEGAITFLFFSWFLPSHTWCCGHAQMQLPHKSALGSCALPRHAPEDFLQLAPLKMSHECNTSLGRVPVLLSSFLVQKSLIRWWQCILVASCNSRFAVLWGEDSSLGGSLCYIRACWHRKSLWHQNTHAKTVLWDSPFPPGIQGVS